MALLVRTFEAVVKIPYSTLSFLDWAWRWSSQPENVEPMSCIWADNLFPPYSTKSLESVNMDDRTDISGSEMCDDEEVDEDEWASDEEWRSDSDEEWDTLSFGSARQAEFCGDRWLWESTSEDEVDEVGTSSFDAQTLTKYAMPSMDLYPDAGIDSWVDKYGASGSIIHLVTTAVNDCNADGNSSRIGIFVAVL